MLLVPKPTTGKRLNEALLLDTHAWLWLMEEGEMNAASFQLCRDAARQNLLLLSPISLWEIGLKASHGKLEIPAPVREWLRSAVSKSRVNLARFDLDVACESSELPAEFHGDPADRIIAATCRMNSYTFLTRDTTLLELSARGFFHAHRI